MDAARHADVRRGARPSGLAQDVAVHGVGPPVEVPLSRLRPTQRPSRSSSVHDPCARSSCSSCAPAASKSLRVTVTRHTPLQRDSSPPDGRLDSAAARVAAPSLPLRSSISAIELRCQRVALELVVDRLHGSAQGRAIGRRDAHEGETASACRSRRSADCSAPWIVANNGWTVSRPARLSASC